MLFVHVYIYIERERDEVSPQIVVFVLCLLKLLLPESGECLGGGQCLPPIFLCSVQLLLVLFGSLHCLE